MKKQILLAVLSLSAIFSAHAASPSGLSLGVGIDQWTWEEYSASGERLLRESGPVPYVEGRWEAQTTPLVSQAVTVKLAGNSIDYNGQYLDGTPLNTTTEYRSLRAEYTAGVRIIEASHPLELIGAVGYEYRSRAIYNPRLGGDQREDWQTITGRIGLEMAKPAKKGFYGGAGVLVPLFTTEDFHGTDIGLDSSPALNPKRDTGYYAKAGYRINSKYTVQASYEALRYAQSDAVRVMSGNDVVNIIQPRSELDRIGIQLIAAF